MAQQNIVGYNFQPNRELKEIATIKDISGWIQFKPETNIDPLNVFEKFPKAFGLSGDDKMLVYRTETDQLGDVHYRYQQYSHGIPVEGAQFLVHARDGKSKNANGKIVLHLNVAASPTISEEHAVEAAKDFVHADTYMWEVESEENLLKRIRRDPNATYAPVAELLFMDKKYSFNALNYKLVYKVEIRALKPMVRMFVFIDATSGEVYHFLDMIQHTNVEGVAETKYNQTQKIMTDSVNPTLYRLVETTRGNGIETYNMQNGTTYGTAIDFTDDDNYWDESVNQADAATNAHWAAEMTYDYYKNVHNRLSYDNANSPLISFVHYDVNYANAFWNGEYMTYGDGDVSNYTALTSLDVCGHEITHGVTEFSANLVYQDESGAMNESFSDIFGACIEFYADTVNPDWKVGEDFDLAGMGFRDMSDPQANGDPDTYLGDGWDYDPNGYDNGGVHTNSGVGNYWFYLLSVGGSGTNSNNDVYDVTALELDKTAQIAYRTLSVYLIPSSNYYDFRNASIQAAADLYGACSNEVIETSKAWYAVGVGYPIENYDIWLKEITSPLTDCGLGNEEVSILLVYNGCDITLNTGDTIYVGYDLDAGASVIDTIVLADTLFFGDSLAHTFSTPVDASIVGVHSLHCWADYQLDSADYNNEITGYEFEHKLQQNIDLGVIAIKAPVEDCQLGDELVEIEIAFFGCDSLAAYAIIPVAYRMNDTLVVWDTIVTDSVIYAAETFRHIFNTPVNLSVQGSTFIFDSWTAYAPDSLTTNDEFQDYTIKNPISVKDKTITFENNNNAPSHMIVETNVQSDAYISNMAESSGTYGFLMTGGDDPMSYIDLIQDLDTNHLWTELWPFVSKVSFCIDVTELVDLDLSFDLKQTFSAVYEQYLGDPNPQASTMRVLVNGIQVGDIYNPVTETGDPYLTHVINLDSLAGTNFQLSFQTLCFIAQGSTYGVLFGADKVYLDNIFISGTKILETTDHSACVNNDTNVTIYVTDNVGNPTQSSLTVSIDQVAGNGTAVVISDTAILYTPDSAFVGIDTVAYIISFTGDSSTAVSAFLFVSVNDPVTFLSEVICSNDSTLFGGMYYNTGGVYYDTIVTAFGCDHIQELTITVNQVQNTFLNTVVCSDDSVLFDGVYYHETGVYYTNLLTTTGCDSIVELTLTVNSISALTQLNQEICANDSLLFGGVYHNTEAVYYDSLENDLGCDSVVELTLTVNALPILDLGANDSILIDSSITLDAGSGFSSYVWSTGATTETLVVDSNLVGVGEHTFSVTVTGNNDCSASDSVVITVKQDNGILELRNSGFTIYPNPNAGVFYLECPSDTKGKIFVEMYDLPGRKISTDAVHLIQGSEKRIKIDISSESKGIYICKIMTGKNIFIEKIVVEYN